MYHHNICLKYKDLTATSLEWWLVGYAKTAWSFRSGKCCNSARYNPLTELRMRSSVQSIDIGPWVSGISPSDPWPFLASRTWKSRNWMHPEVSVAPPKLRNPTLHTSRRVSMSSHPGFVRTHPTARAFSSTWWGAMGRGMSSAGYGEDSSGWFGISPKMTTRISFKWLHGCVKKMWYTQISCHVISINLSINQSIYLSNLIWSDLNLILNRNLNLI